MSTQCLSSLTRPAPLFSQYSHLSEKRKRKGLVIQLDHMQQHSVTACTVNTVIRSTIRQSGDSDMENEELMAMLRRNLTVQSMNNYVPP